MKKIAWISPECFIDVDLPIIAELIKYFNIHWQIILEHDSRVNYDNFIKQHIKTRLNINIKFLHQKYRSRDLRNIKFYLSIINTAKENNPDVYYISYYAQPYGIILFKLLLPTNKCIVACHNVTTPQGASGGIFVKYYTHYWLKTFKNIQVFSKGQKNELEKKFKNKNILMAPLAIKDYGTPNKKIDKIKLPYIRFLFFGNILDYKRIDLLIDASNILYSKGIRNFKVRIAGNCKEWDKKYSIKIKHPQIYELTIRRIPNEDVADLFADSHYFVMPYQDIAQSGAITVAFRYNLPTIVSDIEQFKEFVIPNVTGYTFENKNAEDLANKMLYVIQHHTDIYSQLCHEQHKHVEKELSLESIISKYSYYINNI